MKCCQHERVFTPYYYIDHHIVPQNSPHQNIPANLSRSFIDQDKDHLLQGESEKLSHEPVVSSRSIDCIDNVDCVKINSQGDIVSEAPQVSCFGDGGDYFQKRETNMIPSFPTSVFETPGGLKPSCALQPTTPKVLCKLNSKNSPRPNGKKKKYTRPNSSSPHNGLIRQELPLNWREPKNPHTRSLDVSNNSLDQSSDLNPEINDDVCRLKIDGIQLNTNGLS